MNYSPIKDYWLQFWIQTKVYLIVGAVCLLIGFILGFSISFYGNKGADKLTSIDAGITHHKLVCPENMQALDKRELRDEGAISKKILKDEKKEVLATGITSGDEGTTNIAAVLDTETGLTHIEEKRPLFESIGRNELGIGVGFGSSGMIKALSFEHTFFRAWDLYGSGQGVIADVKENGVSANPWHIMVWAKYHF